MSKVTGQDSASAANHDPTLRQYYQDNGFVFWPGVLSPDEAAALLDMVRPAIEGELGHVGFGEEGNKEIKHGRQQQIMITEDGPVPGLASHPYRARAKELGEFLTGARLRFMYGQLIYKPEHYDARVQWHQDGHYWPDEHAGEASITCWTALTESVPENGSVGYVSGSHRKGQLDHADATGQYEFHRAFEVPDPSPDSIVHARLSPGDAAFHHSLCIHGSAGNQTDNPRIGIVSHFFPVR